MAILKDLTFAQLAAELPAGAVTYDAGNSDILISVKAVTGDTYTGLANTGVVEALYKVRAAATDAQTTANAALAAGDTPLAAFPNFAYGIPNAEGEVPVTQTTNVVIPLNIGTVQGAN